MTQVTEVHLCHTVAHF